MFHLGERFIVSLFTEVSVMVFFFKDDATILY